MTLFPRMMRPVCIRWSEAMLHLPTALLVVLLLRPWSQFVCGATVQLSFCAVTGTYMDPVTSATGQTYDSYRVSIVGVFNTTTTTNTTSTTAYSPSATYTVTGLSHGVAFNTSSPSMSFPVQFVPPGSSGFIIGDDAMIYLVNGTAQLDGAGILFSSPAFGHLLGLVGRGNPSASLSVYCDQASAAGCGSYASLQVQPYDPQNPTFPSCVPANVVQLSFCAVTGTYMDPVTSATGQTYDSYRVSIVGVFNTTTTTTNTTSTTAYSPSATYTVTGLSHGVAFNTSSPSMSFPVQFVPPGSSGFIIGDDAMIYLVNGTAQLDGAGILFSSPAFGHLLGLVGRGNPSASLSVYCDQASAAGCGSYASLQVQPYDPQNPTFPSCVPANVVQLSFCAVTGTYMDPVTSATGQTYDSYRVSIVGVFNTTTTTNTTSTTAYSPSATYTVTGLSHGVAFNTSSPSMSFPVQFVPPGSSGFIIGDDAMIYLVNGTAQLDGAGILFSSPAFGDMLGLVGRGNPSASLSVYCDQASAAGCGSYASLQVQPYDPQNPTFPSCVPANVVQLSFCAVTGTYMDPVTSATGQTYDSYRVSIVGVFNTTTTTNTTSTTAYSPSATYTVTGLSHGVAFNTSSPSMSFPVQFVPPGSSGFIIGDDAMIYLVNGTAQLDGAGILFSSPAFGDMLGLVGRGNPSASLSVYCDQASAAGCGSYASLQVQPYDPQNPTFPSCVPANVVQLSFCAVTGTYMDPVTSATGQTYDSYRVSIVGVFNTTTTTNTTSTTAYSPSATYTVTGLSHGVAFNTSSPSMSFPVQFVPPGSSGFIIGDDAMIYLVNGTAQLDGAGILFSSPAFGDMLGLVGRGNPSASLSVYCDQASAAGCGSYASLQVQPYDPQNPSFPQCAFVTASPSSIASSSSSSAAVPAQSSATQSADLCLLIYSLPGTVDYPWSLATAVHFVYASAPVTTVSGTAIALLNGTGTRTFTNRFGVSYTNPLTVSNGSNLLYLNSPVPVDSQGITLQLPSPIQQPGRGPTNLSTSITVYNSSGVVAENGSSRTDSRGVAFWASVPGFYNVTIGASNINALAAVYSSCSAPITFTNGLRPPHPTLLLQRCGARRLHVFPQ